MSKEHAKKYEDAVKRFKALVTADCLDGRFDALEHDD